MKRSTLACYALFVIGLLMWLSEMWFQVWGPALFLKLIITDAILFVIVFSYVFLMRESKATDKIHKGGNSLD